MKKMNLSYIFIFALSLIYAGGSVAVAENIKIELDTTKGKIDIELYADKTPITVANFVNLTKRGYYNGIKFHRVIPDFMVQGGDPDGMGTGGPGYEFEDEFVDDLRHTGPGILSMANRGPRTNGSQFFITHVPTPWLDGKHTVFGRVVSGQDIVDAIKQGDEIKTAKITAGDADAVLAKAKPKVDEWNAILDKKYPAN
jgi:peptidyl-prolyl cis-trans isomerase B (cyclophilin B)